MVTHGTVLALYVAAVTGVDAIDLWRRLGLPSYVTLTRPDLTLVDIVEKSAGIAPPAAIVIGDVVSLADKLQWFIPKSDHKPLYGSEQEREPARA